MVENLIKNGNPNKIPPPLGENSPASVAYSSFFDKINLSHETQGTLYESHAELYSTLNDFCGDQIHNLAYNAAMLTGIYRLQDDFVLSRNARRALRDSFAQCGTEGNAKYVLGLLRDEEKIDGFWRTNAASLETRYGDQSEWMSRTNLVDFSHLSNLIDKINLESLLITSAKTLNYLRTHDEKTPEVLDKICQAESMLAPICEIIGFDGLAMALNNVCTISRFNSTGRGHYIELAQSIINQYGSSDMIFDAITDSVAECLGRGINADYDYAVNSLPNDSFYRTLFVHGIAVSNTTGGELDIKGRLKTVGSLAEKLYKAKEKYGNIIPPMDIMALTIVTEDVEQSAKIFEMIAKNTALSKTINLVPASSKKHALYIQGESDFIHRFSTHNSNIEVREVPAGDGIQVAKATFGYQEQPGQNPLHIEIQVVTLADRMAMRYGARCHAAYKGNHVLDAETLVVLDEIHDRRKYIDQKSLVAPDAELDAAYEKIINVDRNVKRAAGRHTVRKTVDL